MSSSNRQANSSPSDRQRAKSRSSSQSHRTSPNKTAQEEDRKRAKTSSHTSKSNGKENSSTKRSDTSPSNRSTNPASPNSNKSKKSRSHGKTPTSSSPKSKSKSPSPNRKGLMKKKKSSISTSDADGKNISQPNDSERQDLSSQGLSFVPLEIFQRMDIKLFDMILKIFKNLIFILVYTLRRLILSNNNLSGLPSNISALVNLEHLDISRNPLRVKNGLDDFFCLPREFCYLRNLQTLIMGECTLKHIPAIVWQTTSLETLDISRNKIGYIVSEIGT